MTVEIPNAESIKSSHIEAYSKASKIIDKSLDSFIRSGDLGGLINAAKIAEEESGKDFDLGPVGIALIISDKLHGQFETGCELVVKKSIEEGVVPQKNYVNSNRLKALSCLIQMLGSEED